MDLYIQSETNNQFTAYTQTGEEKRYVMGKNNRPLKFISVEHVKDYFEGYKFNNIWVIDSDDKAKQNQIAGVN